MREMGKHFNGESGGIATTDTENKMSNGSHERHYDASGFRSVFASIRISSIGLDENVTRRPCHACY